MPEPQTSVNRQIVAIAMIISAVSLAVIAYLIYAGTIPLSEDVRLIAALIVGGAAFADFLVGLWFFRMGQSS
jgi:hypothetical protein